MQTVELKLNVPEEIFYTLNESKEDFSLKIKFYTAMELFKEHKLSLGKASELADMNKIDFMFELGKYEVPIIDYDKDDFREELKRINK